MTPGATTRPHLVERAAELLARQAPAVAEPPGPPPLAWPDATPTARVASGFAAPITLEALRAAGLLSGQPNAAQHRMREEIAMVQHQLLRQVDDTATATPVQRRIVLLASALPGEGKSFLSLNLAHGIASRGARPVLLVDADGKAESLTALLGAGGRPGLRELIAAATGRGTDFVLETAVERLSFLPSGLALPVDSNAPRGTVAAAIQRLAAALPEHILILDSPACLSSSEATALAGVAGQVLLVVAAERTLRHEVEAALDALDACPVLRLVLNHVRLGAHGGHDAARAEQAHA